MKKKSVFIAGAGHLGKEIYGWIITDPAGAPFEIVGFVDDQDVDLSSSGIDLPVCRPADWSRHFAGAGFIPAVLMPAGRRAMVGKLLEAGATAESYRHSSVLISHGATLGEGCVLLPQSVVNWQAKLGRFVVANAGCSIGHDNVIGDYVTFLGGNTINGAVTIGSDAVLGSRSIIHPLIKIGEGATIGIGSVVVGNVAPRATVFGNPARALPDGRTSAAQAAGAH